MNFEIRKFPTQDWLGSFMVIRSKLMNSRISLRRSYKISNTVKTARGILRS